MAILAYSCQDGEEGSQDKEGWGGCRSELVVPEKQMFKLYTDCKTVLCKLPKQAFVSDS